MAGLSAGLAGVAWLLAGYLLAPRLIEGRLARFGASSAARTVEVDRIAFDPFTLTATLDGLDLSDAGAVLEVGRVRANFSAASLLRWSPVLDSLTLERARIALAGRLGPGWRRRAAAAAADRVAALPELDVADLAVRDAELTLTGAPAEGDAAVFVARAELTANDVSNADGRLAVGGFRLRAEEADGFALELTGRTLEPVRVTGRFDVGSLELARVVPLLGGPFAARSPSGVLDARGAFAFSGGLASGTLEIGGATAELTDASALRDAGGAVSIRRLESELDAVVELAAPSAVATGRFVLLGASLSGPRGATAALGAERVTADAVEIVLPGGRLAAASAEITGARVRVDLAAGGPGLPEWPLTVDEIRLADGDLGLMDSSTAPAVEVGVEDVAGRIAGLEAGGLPREIAVEGRLGGTADGSFAARLVRAQTDRVGSADLAFAQLDARALSPYAERAGWRVDAGRVDLGLSYRAEAGAPGITEWAVAGLELARAAPAPDPGLPLAFAAALETGADGVLRFSAPLDAAAAPALERALPYLPDLAGAALARRAGQSVSEPFAVLARLVDAAARPETLAAVPFPAGSAELTAAAEERLASLAAALRQRPLLAIGTGASYAAAMDRAALAAEQVRVHVSLATADAARLDPPERLDFASLRTQDVLDEFAGQRLTQRVRAELAARFAFDADAAPSQRAPYYEAVFMALADNEPVSAQMRNRLARYRSLTIADALERHGVAAERFIGAAEQPEPGTDDEEGVLVPLVLDVVPPR